MPLFQQTITTTQHHAFRKKTLRENCWWFFSQHKHSNLKIVRWWPYEGIFLLLRKIPRKPPIWYTVLAYRKLRPFSTPFIANFLRSGRDLAKGWISGAEFASIAERAGIFSILFPLKLRVPTTREWNSFKFPCRLSFFSCEIYACRLILLHYLNLVCGDFRKKEND